MRDRASLPEAPPAKEPVLRRTLLALAAEAERLGAIAKADLRPGDWVFVTTRNSVYCLHVNGDGTYSVAGGWFERHGSEPACVRINGCTFGGTAIKTDIVAAPGLFMEFDNRVTTTRIREARILRGDARPTYH